MKSTGIVRRVDSLGRIVLPVELRQKLELDKDSALEIFTEGNQIILRKYEPSCVFCGEAKDVETYKGRNICAKCRKAISEL